MTIGNFDYQGAIDAIAQPYPVRDDSQVPLATVASEFERLIPTFDLDTLNKLRHLEDLSNAYDIPFDTDIPEETLTEWDEICQSLSIEAQFCAAVLCHYHGGISEGWRSYSILKAEIDRQVGQLPLL